jgi:hypothetical protein
MSEIDVFEALATSYWALSAAVPPGLGIVGAYPGLRFGVLGGPIADINRVMPTKLSPDTGDADLGDDEEPSPPG